MTYWRAVCAERCKHGSGRGRWKPATAGGHQLGATSADVRMDRETGASRGCLALAGGAQRRRGRATDRFGAASAKPNVIEVSGLKNKNDGNNVDVDREARLLAENALRFSVASNLAHSEISTIRTAIQEGGKSS